MPSLKHCSGVWFAVAGTGSEETAIDNPASAGGGWNLLWFVTEKLLHVLEESVALFQAAGRGQTRTFAPHPDQMTCLVHPLQLCSWYFSVWKVHSQNLHSVPSDSFFFSELSVQRQAQEQQECSAIGSLLHHISQEKHSDAATMSFPFVTLKIH